MTYYYFAATLPLLTFGETPALSFRRFRELCRQHLSAGDRAVFARIFGEAGPAWRHPALGDLARRAAQLGNAVIRARAARRGVDASPLLRVHRGYDVHIERAVAEAFARRDPRERELALDRLRWQMIETWAGGDPFTFRAVVAYGLKLGLAERWAGLEAAAGAAKVEGFLEQQVRENPAG